MLKYIKVFFVTKYKVYFWYLLKESFLLVFLWNAEKRHYIKMQKKCKKSKTLLKVENDTHIHTHINSQDSQVHRCFVCEWVLLEPLHNHHQMPLSQAAALEHNTTHCMKRHGQAFAFWNLALDVVTGF